MSGRAAAAAHSEREDTTTADGALVRLVVDERGEPVGAVVIETPNAWVLRKPVLTVDDIA